MKAHASIFTAEPGDRFETYAVDESGAAIKRLNDDESVTEKDVPLYVEDPEACRRLAAALIEAADRIEAVRGVETGAEQ